MAWLIAPQRKWDTVTQTSSMYTTKPSEPVQIRYNHNTPSQEDLSISLIDSYQLPVTIPTQVQCI